MNTLKQFDAFAKPLEEVQIKTVWGGIGKKWFLARILFNIVLQLYSSVSIYHTIVLLYIHISIICNIIIVLIINSYNFVIGI